MDNRLVRYYESNRGGVQNFGGQMMLVMQDSWVRDSIVAMTSA